MSIPQVAIVGRPNVGKSSLFNWLVGERIAIVDSMAGVTRDRMTHLVELGGRLVELVDTGGMGIEDTDDLTDHVEQQIRMAIDSADLVLFLVDVRSGHTPLDDHVARRVRGIDPPVVVVANKTDNDSLASQADEFYRLGFPLVRISAKQKRGRAELVDAILEHLPQPQEGEDEQAEIPVMKVALVGRRNVGKSTFINTLTESERMIVSPIPGTTRDSVDVRYEMDGLPFIAIDTPGFRRRKSVNTDIDFYGTRRAERSIRRADVVLMLFDAGQRIGKVDKQLCNFVAEQHKPCIFVVNKWDLMVGEMATERWADYLRDTFQTMAHVPIAFITGQTGKNVKKLLNYAQMLFKQSRARVTTGQLNRLLRIALDYNPPPLYQNRRPKVYYAVQADVAPPTIVIFCNNPDAFSQQYRRYLLTTLRDELEFCEVPIKVYFRKRGAEDSQDEIDSHLGNK